MANTNQCSLCGSRKVAVCNRPYDVNLMDRIVELASVEVLECTRCGRKRPTPKGEETIRRMLRAEVRREGTLH
jgi:hypothetical protein